jgi:chromosome segregation ATPase
VEKDDKLDNIPAIKPGQDDALYRRSGKSEAPKQSNFNGLLVFVILLMVIVMGVGGYTLYEVQLKLDEANVLLAKGQDNIKALEDRLAATGTDVSKTLQDMQEQIKENFKQIDLLWGHAYRTNKPNITKNTNAISALRKNLEGEVKPLTQSVNRVKSNFQTLSDEMSGVKQNLQDDAEEITTQVALVRGQVEDQAVVVEANRRNATALTKQLVEVQEAIDVIDAYRRQINQRLTDLQSQIRTQNDAP